MSPVSHRKSFTCSCLSCQRRMSRQDRQLCALPGFKSAIDGTLEHSELVLTSMRSHWGGKVTSVTTHRWVLQVSAPFLSGFLGCSELTEANGSRLLRFPGWTEVYWLCLEPDLRSLDTQRLCRAAFSATRCSNARKRISEDFPSPCATLQFFRL